MTAQLMLSSFAKKTISVDESTKGFRPWNNLILNWEVEYRGYSREDGEPEGYVDFHVVVEITEALVKVRTPKTYKKVKRPGYKLIVVQNMAFEGREWDGCIVYEESFIKDRLKRVFDVFHREVLNIQRWIRIAESRARLIPNRADVFGCPFCGWATNVWMDDITCEGCGKRFWSGKLWKRNSIKHKN
jgi:hypothetical protein